MVLNGTTGNLYNVDKSCKDVATITNKMTTVFAIFDMCKDVVESYPLLNRVYVDKKKKAVSGEFRGSG